MIQGTHDRVEAMTMAKKLVVRNVGHEGRTCSFDARGLAA